MGNQKTFVWLHFVGVVLAMVGFCFECLPVMLLGGLLSFAGCTAGLLTASWVAFAALLLTGAAGASEAHAAWTQRAIQSLPRFHDDAPTDEKRAELAAIADEVARLSVNAPRPPREWASLLLTVGFRESGFSRDVIAGRCKPEQCDHGRARGFGQVHRNGLNASDWERAHGDVAVQAKLAHDALVRGYWQCARSGVPWVQATLNGYKGTRCGASWDGLELRLATYARLIAR